MDEITEALIARVRQARADLRRAAESTDAVAMGAALDELENALHLAREHGVEVPPAEDGSRGRMGS